MNPNSRKTAVLHFEFRPGRHCGLDFGYRSGLRERINIEKKGTPPPPPLTQKRTLHAVQMEELHRQRSVPKAGKRFDSL